VNNKKKQDLIAKLQNLADPAQNPSMTEALSAQDKIAELLEELSRNKKRGDGRTFLRGSIYWIAYSLRGREYRESAKTSDENEAGKFLKARMKQVGADQIGARKFTTPQACKLTCHDLLETLKAEFELDGKLSPQAASQIRRADRAFGNVPAANLDRDTINAYKKEQRALGYAKATINRALEHLSLAFKLAMEAEKLSYMPPIKMYSEKGNERKGFVEPADFEKILAQLPADLKDFCQWGYETGQRKGETSLLEWRMIDGDVLRIPGSITKNGESRTLPLSPGLAKIIERRRAVRQVEINGVTQLCPFIFHRANGEPVRNFLKAWRAACKKAGLPSVLYHDLRRSCARNLTQAGVPREVAKIVTGHVSDSCWNRYNIVITADARKALEQTEAYISAETAKQKVVSMP
jgi:integrase